MKFAEVAENVTRLLDELPSQETFIYELLLAYGSPKATVERENHSGKTMAQLYDPDKMPDGLREAHHNLDLAVRPPLPHQTL